MASEIFGDRFTSRYEVQQQLAKKSGRRTLLARDLVTHELVVVKILSFSSDFEWDDLKLFEREAASLKTLSHRSIPRYLDYFELDSPSFKGFALVQTYIPAKSLDKHLATGAVWRESDVKQIAIALLEILIYLHGHQPSVIHRDIKPSNILLTDHKNNAGVYLVDFGSVQTLAAREGGTMTVVGTYGYMPPEQFGDRAVPASDLYSLGATLIALVTGMHPADLPHCDGRLQFDQIATLSPAFIRWLKRMTEPSLERRFASATQALQALSQPRLTESYAIAPLGKPSRSRVVLKKNAETLEIVLPPKGFSLEIVALALFAIPWNSFLLTWTWIVLMVPFPMKLFFGLFSLPFWGVGVTMVWQIVASLFQQVRLQLDARRIAIVYEITGIEYRYRFDSIREVFKLQRIFRHFQRDSGGDRVEVKSQLNIWVGTQKYELNANGWLSEPEIDWLAQELSDWLAIPVTKE